MPSSRNVKTRVGSEVVAETARPQILFESSLPSRYYIPEEDVRADLLENSDTTSVCPYKGTARSTGSVPPPGLISHGSTAICRAVLRRDPWSISGRFSACLFVQTSDGDCCSAFCLLADFL